VARTIAFNGLKWSAIDSFFAQIMNFIIGVILARLLTPEDFGLIGMITVFIAVSQIFVNSGINDALIRKQGITESYYNTAFIFNITISILLYLILFFTADYIAEFYEQPSLTIIVRIIAITLILNALTLVQKAQMAKKIDFKSLAKVNLIASLVSGVVGITMAYLDYGVWSLVWRTVLLSAISLIIISLITKWTPTLRFSKSAFKDLFGFGSRLMILGIIDTIYQNIYLLIIGKYFSAGQLGQYTRAETFKRLPAQGITQIIQRVSYPLLAQMQNDPVKLRKSYSGLIKSVMLVSITGLFVLAAMAENLTIVLLGEEWKEAGIYLRILCFSAIFYPLDALNSNILKVMNRSDLILKIGIWRKIIAIPVILILIFYGIIPFLYTLIIHQFISYLLISNFSKKYINYGTVDQIKDFLPVLITMGFVFAGLTLLGMSWGGSHLIHLIVTFIAGIIGSFLIFYFFRFDSFIYLKQILKKQYKK